MTVNIVTVPELLEAGAAGVTGLYDKNADFIRGSDYDVLLGPVAVIGSRQHLRDRDLFRAIHVYSATGDDLTYLAEVREGINRILDTRGEGVATLTRPTASVTTGTIYEGTRFAITSDGHKVYRATADVAVAATDSQILVPIEAEEPGVESAIAATANIRIEDPIFDATLVVTRLDCAAGTAYESSTELIDRIRAQRLAGRVGHETAIVKACTDVGATYVATFRNDYAGDAYDYGLNYVYVGDSGYSANADLLKRCRVALRSVRVLGDNLQVLPMSREELVVSAKIFLNQPLTNLSVDKVKLELRSAILRYFGGTGEGWAYTIEGLAAALAGASEEVRHVIFNSPTTDSTLLTNFNFPAVLKRYVVRRIDFQFVNP